MKDIHFNKMAAARSPCLGLRVSDISSLVFNKSLSNFATLLILRVLSHVDGFSLTGPSQKLKNIGKSITMSSRESQ